MDFDGFFKAATGHDAGPYGYQRRLACGERQSRESEAHWLARSTPCESRLIDIPTGLGKTAAVTLAWLYNRLQIENRKSEIGNRKSEISNEVWPRRLVYCLPMRTLVEQTRDCVQEWLVRLAYAAAPDEEGVSEARRGLPGAARERLKRDENGLRRHTGDLAGARGDLLWLARHSPIILMGGEDTSDFGFGTSDLPWDVHPEKPVILIGTQDMLLSRALNRGYGMSRYRWPMHFGLLNNDCLWVLDETQLMGVGVETSAQLDGLRQLLKIAPNGCRTWWMSATLDDARLATVDYPKPEPGWPRVKLEAADLDLPAVKDRFEANKPVAPAPNASLSAGSKKSYADRLAGFIHKQHLPDSLTLVVLNRVDRAQEVYQQLQKLRPAASLALIHSRFRPGDRQRHEAVLHGADSRIVIATQAVEAGVDVSARTLITELAPWPALVQRFGRCNRRGEWKDGEARVLWVDICLKGEGDDLALPYTAAELEGARAVMESLRDAGPTALSSVAAPPEPPVVRPVLRRKDLVELFDATPDLAGHDLDISRFIRDGDDTDVQVFWRDCAGNPNEPLQPEPTPAELCRVTIGNVRKFFDREHTQAWQWNPLAKRWDPARKPHPGGIYLLTAASGGYSEALGWTGIPADQPKPHPPGAGNNEAYDADSDALSRHWQMLADHTRAVVEEASRLVAQLAPDLAPVFRAAAQWHDVGKAHKVFQDAIRRGPHQPSVPDALYAKSRNRPSGYAPPEHARFFRHELASALAWLQAAPPDAPERDLVAYLIAAHHGKVRLSIRSLPGEEPTADRPDARLARGILDGDPLGPVEIQGVSLPAITLDLSLMEMGWDAEREPQRGPSWLARTLALRERFGPFRLAFLETLLRAADARASARVAAPEPGGDSDVFPGMELCEEPPASAILAGLTPAEQSLVADLVADGLSIQDKFRPEPLYQQTGRGHYESGTVEEIRKAKPRKGQKP